MLRLLPGALVWPGFASGASRRRRGGGRDRSRGPKTALLRKIKHIGHIGDGDSRGGRMGVSAVGGRLSAGSGGSLGGQRCRACSGEPCGWHLHLLKGHVSAIVAKYRPAAEGGSISASMLGGRHQPCTPPLFRLEAFGVPRVFRDVLPPVEGRAPFFLRPRGTAPVVRLAVCCFWPAIAPEVF